MYLLSIFQYVSLKKKTSLPQSLNAIIILRKFNFETVQLPTIRFSLKISDCPNIVFLPDFSNKLCYQIKTM